MNRLGLALSDLSASELTWRLVTQANALHRRGSHDITFFFHEPALCSPSLFGASMQLFEAWGYDGPVVATTLAAARQLAAFPSPAARLFYVWDFEWLRMNNRNFRALRAVYGDPRLTLVARTAAHKAILEDLWCREVKGVVADADLLKLLEVCRT